MVFFYGTNFATVAKFRQFIPIYIVGSPVYILTTLDFKLVVLL